MLTPLAQAADATSTSSLSSSVTILAATFVIVAIAKSLFAFKGRVTLVVALVVSVGLTLLAIYGTGTLAADPFDALLAVLMGVSGAAGIDASGRAIFGKAAAIPLALGVLLLGGCASMSPTQRYAFSSNGFAATVDQVAALIALGVIDDGGVDDIQRIAHQIDAEFDAWDAALRNNIPLDSRFVLARVERLLGRLVQYQLDAEQGAWHGPGNGFDVGDDGDPVGREGDRTGRAGEGGEAGVDACGTGHREGDAQGVDAGAGRRDRVAAQLRGLDMRCVELLTTAMD